MSASTGRRLIAVTQRQPRLAALGGFFVALLFVGGFQNERRHGYWPARYFVDRHEGYIRGSGVLSFSGQIILRVNFDADFHRSVKDAVDLGFEDDDFAK